MAELQPVDRDGRLNPSRASRTPRMLLCFVGVSFAVAAGVAVVFSPREWNATTVPLKKAWVEAKAQFDAGRYEEAESAAAAVAADGDERLWLLAADAAVRRDRLEAAEDYWSRLEGQGGVLEAAASVGRGEAYFHVGKLQEGAESYRHALRIDPSLISARRGLVYIYAIGGLTYQAAPHTRALLKTGDHFREALALLADADAVLQAPDDMVQKSEAIDPMLLVGFARRARKSVGRSASEEHVVALFDGGSWPMDGYTELGMLWEEDPRLLRTWFESAPSGVEVVPDYWYLSGRLAEYEDRYAASLGCYLRAIELSYDHLRATYAAGQVARKLGATDVADEFSSRAAVLQDYAVKAQKAFKFPDAVGWPIEMGRIASSLGRDWEAVAWSEIALRLDDSASIPREILHKSLPKLSPVTPFEDADYGARMAAAWDVAERWPAAERPSGDGSSAVAVLRSGGSERGGHGDGTFAFADDTSAAGVDFSYLDLRDAEIVGRQMHEFTGAGVGAFDFDGDLRPDLCFPQSAEGPPGERFVDRGPDGDVLLRNIGGVRYVDVTRQAAYFAPGHGQGVACGDFDADGFLDVYVAQVGTNRLLLNNGDGTFRDGTEAAGLNSQVWTVSCAIADLDADGTADLIDVNYLGGEEVFTKVCHNGEMFISCTPLGFPPEPDALFAGTGGPSVRDVSAESGVADTPANGLGVVIGRLDADARLDAFIANDLMENHFLAGAGEPGRPRFEDDALVRGLALNRHAEAEACMGIAAGDADQDGLVDLFVTNFLHESNTLYVNAGDSSFADNTATFGLIEPGQELMGFGTQFLDIDLDGLEDLVVSNGHVDKQPDTPFAMRPLAFRNRGTGFVDLRADELGGYFAEEHVGRALARLDWNEDGRDDFVVTHLTTPARLVSNATESGNRSARFALRATVGHRDAIGAIARLTAVSPDGVERSMTRQLTAGDGYESSNERWLTFGLREGEATGTLTVDWPSGGTETWPASAGRHVVVEQGRGQRPVPGSASDG